MLGRTMSILWTSDCTVRHLTNAAVIDTTVVARRATVRELRSSRSQTNSRPRRIGDELLRQARAGPELPRWHQPLTDGPPELPRISLGHGLPPGSSRPNSYNAGHPNGVKRNGCAQESDAHESSQSRQVSVLELYLRVVHSIL